MQLNSAGFRIQYGESEMSRSSLQFSGIGDQAMIDEVLLRDVCMPVKGYVRRAGACRLEGGLGIMGQGYSQSPPA